MVGKGPDRLEPRALSGQTVSGGIFVFAAAVDDPAQDFSEATTVLEAVRFTLRRADGSAVPVVTTEWLAPFDLGRTAGEGTALPFDTTTLRNGNYVLQAELTFNDETIDGCEDANHASTAEFTVLNHPDCRVAVFVSSSSTRADPEPLQGRTISGDAYVFLGGPDRPRRDLSELTTILETVTFRLRPPAEVVAPGAVTEGFPAFDLGRTSADGTAWPFRSAAWPDGEYYLNSQVVFKDWTLYRCGDANRGQWTWFTISN
jgi:hypothetical protein